MNVIICLWYAYRPIPRVRTVCTTSFIFSLPSESISTLMNLLRRNSRADDVHEENENDESKSVYSDDTLVRVPSYSSSLAASALTESPDVILGHAYQEFTKMRVMPVISCLFQKGHYMFESEESFDVFKKYGKNTPAELAAMGLGTPFFHIVSPTIALKKSTPFMMIYKKGAEFARIYHYFKDSIAHYEIHLATGEKIHMLHDATHPFTDTVYKNSRLRWQGTTGFASLFGSGLFKLVSLHDESSLCDGMAEDGTPAVTRLPKQISKSRYPPIARFSDSTSKMFPTKRMQRYGDIRCVEVYDPRSQGITNDTQVIAVMALILREQESRKYHGAPTSILATGV